MVVFMFLGGNFARKYGILDGAFNQSLPEVREILDKHRQSPVTDAQLMRAALAELAYAPSTMRNKMPDWYARHALILSKISAEIDAYVQSQNPVTFTVSNSYVPPSKQQT